MATITKKSDLGPNNPNNHHLLLAGLKFDAKISEEARAIVGPPAAIEKAIREDAARALAAGFSYTELQIDPDLAEEHLAVFEGLLQTGTYDAVMIGGGVRMNPQLTTLLEKMVNACRRIAPGAHIMFDTGPGTTTKCLERLYGVTFE
ncbi:Ubiquinone menaquinone biosynthesis methyltransferase [Apiospora kogelbergensis]|uniref:Ubiquinone menaquinone biosynthesis methyltransferase n=1 Tax=Apiospora kogelbergensis TaxID=1337665 RepID=UPI0031305263